MAQDEYKTMGRIKGATHAVRRRDAILDVAKALELRLTKGLTYSEIATLLGVSPSRIHQALTKFEAMLQDTDLVAAFRAHEGHVLDAAKMQVLTNMLSPEKLAKGATNTLAYAYTQLNNASRLAKGESTANVSSLTKLIVEAHRAPNCQVEIAPSAKYAESQEKMNSVHAGDTEAVEQSAVDSEGASATLADARGVQLPDIVEVST